MSKRLFVLDRKSLKLIFRLCLSWKIVLLFFAINSMLLCLSVSALIAGNVPGLGVMAIATSLKYKFRKKILSFHPEPVEGCSCCGKLVLGALRG